MGKPGPDVAIVATGAFAASREGQNSGTVHDFVLVFNYRPRETEAKVRLEVRFKDQGDFKLYEKTTNPPLIPARTVSAGDPAKNEAPSDTPGDGVVTFDLTDIDEASNVTLHAKLVGNKDP